MCKFIFKALSCLSLLLLLTQMASALSDPTTPLGFEQKTLKATYVLQSILIGDKRKIAVINGQRLQEQQEIASSGGVKVIAITPYRVELEKNGKRWTLKLRNKTVVRN